MLTPSGGEMIPGRNDPDQAYVLYLDNVFTEHEIDYINNYLKAFPPEKGRVGEAGEGVTKESVRVADVRWIDYRNCRWIYAKIWSAVQSANESCWDFDIMPSTPGLGNNVQYTQYTANSGGHYDWHMDMGTATQWLRKLTFTIQMSKPSEYEGGELWISTSTKHTFKAKKRKGSMTIFPSFLQHRVGRVTKGTRLSMVGWIGGPRWR